MENRSLSDLAGQEFYGEYYAKTNPLGADVPNPVSHVAYGYATQMCIVDKETGLIKKMVAAHDVGKAINPLSCEGQIEGGVVMSMGYALTEKFPLDHGKPTAKYGMLGLFRANQIPEIKALVIDKPGLNLANGAIGIGEITSIPRRLRSRTLTSPMTASAGAPPLDHTPYKNKPSGDAMKHVLIIYTGGTIGMTRTDNGYAPRSGYFRAALDAISDLHSSEMPAWDFMELSPLLDSSNMTVHEWNRIAELIAQQYDSYDGFVVLHGTDTMAYTASALSFMLGGL